MASRDTDISTNISKRENVPSMDFSPMSLAEEAAAGGWTRGTKPVPGEPARSAMIVGTEE